MKNKKLRFAPLIRVSTEGQEEKGESLRTQKTRIIHYVKSLGGVIPKHCWKYLGQEHATPDFREERKMFDQLLKDCSKNLFDAVIVDDYSRFSRDVLKSIISLETLKKNNIEFYKGTSKYNFYSPEHELSMTIITGANQFTASEQTRKSLLNRIEKAKRGCFTAGQPPFGRWRDKETGKLHIIKKDKRLIETAARLYLKENIGFIKIGKRLNKAPSVIQRALLHDGGGTYIQNFKCERLGISESIKTKIPPLLSDNVIKFIQEEAAKRRTYHPGVTTSERLLCSYVFCDDCGKRLTVQEQKTHNKKNGKTYTHIYYRHPKGECKSFSVVKGELLEDLVIKSICGMLKDSKKFKQALLDPHPSEKEKKALKKELSVLYDSIEKIERKERNLISYMEGGVKVNGLEERADKLSNNKKELLQRVDKIKKTLLSLPTEKEIKAYRKLLLKRIEKLDLDNLRHRQKRQLIEMFCRRGRNGQGRRKQAGVYVWRSEDIENFTEFSFSIIGLLGIVVGCIDEYPLIMVDHKEDTVDQKELRSYKLRNSFNAYIGTD